MNLEWCAWPLGPCWTRNEWISVWSSFGGVLIAFILGIAFNAVSQRRQSQRANAFLHSALIKAMEAMRFFDGDVRRIGDEATVAKGFGALSHSAAAVRWAEAHPQYFEPDLFMRLLMVELLITDSAIPGPSSFAGDRFLVDASTYLSAKVPAVASASRFILNIREQN